MKIVIIGGGAAGIMSAISSRRHYPVAEITIIEKNPVLGKKILVCGAGRCNVTNKKISTERYYGSPKKFISTIINQFDSTSIINFLNDLGIETYEEEKNGRKKGKIFPVTNEAKTVTELLKNELEEQKIKITYNSEVKNVINNDKKFIVTIKKFVDDGDTFIEYDLETDYLIVASGGKTYPNLGATGFGFDLAKNFGHSIIEPVPSALPLEAEHPLFKKLFGVRIDAEVTSIINKEEIKSDTDEMMFTKYGLSGPVILNISREISVRINRDKINDCYLKINLLPGHKYEQAYELLSDRWNSKGNYKAKFSLFGLIPNKVAESILEYLDIDGNLTCSELNKSQKQQIVKLLTEWVVKVTDTRTWNEGEFTAGGVNTKEINYSLESKIIPHLYFAGEVLNVDGDVGGFNLSWAWSSGWVAGKLGK